MKKPDNHIEKEIEETLSSVKNVKRITPEPFFYSRLKARIAREQEGIAKTEIFISPVLQPVFAVLLILIFAVNIYTAGRILNFPANEDTISIEQALVDEYYPTTPTLFNITDNQSY